MDGIIKENQQEISALMSNDDLHNKILIQSEEIYQLKNLLETEVSRSAYILEEKSNSARVLEDQIIIKNKTIYDQGNEIKKLKEQMQIMKASENNNDDLLREYTEANVILSGKNKELEIENEKLKSEIMTINTKIDRAL